MTMRGDGRRVPLWAAVLAATAAAAVVLGVWWFAQPGDVPASDPPEQITINRGVEGPSDEFSRTGPVTLWTPPTTQPPKTP